jgi:hypothetical protein
MAEIPGAADWHEGCGVVITIVIPTVAIERVRHNHEALLACPP